MKALFGCLLCLVLATSQSFALKGGPPYPGGSINLTGAYAGVLQPLFDPTDPFSSNSIGIFTTSIPSSGFTTGAFAFFTRGRVFIGTVEGVADPKGATVKAILQADVGDDAGVATDTLPSARGKLDARIVASVNNAQALSAVRVKGDATLFISEGFTDSSGKLIVSEIISLTVDGFKQSNTPSG